MPRRSQVIRALNGGPVRALGRRVGTPPIELALRKWNQDGQRGRLNPRCNLLCESRQPLPARTEVVARAGVDMLMLQHVGHANAWLSKPQLP